MCFRGSKEPSHPDGSFEYPQHAWLRKIIFSYALLSGGLDAKIMSPDQTAPKSDQGPYCQHSI